MPETPSLDDERPRRVPGWLVLGAVVVLVGGVVLGILFALFCRLLVRATARRRARTAERRLRSAISEVADELVLKPVQEVLAGYETTRKGIDQALQ